jgi:polyhydroxybutyrate depolymerase
VHPTPVILLFYGFGSDPAAFATLTGLPARGAAAGSIVVVPHTQPGELEWQFTGSGTDAGFVSAVLTQVEDDYCVDEGKVFATGFSAGAAFSIVYACTHRDRIAAVATVAVEFVLGCAAPLGILAFHGTADPEVPYQDGAVGRSLPGVRVTGTQKNMTAWARLDHCRTAPTTTRVGSQVANQVWHGCAPGTPVQLVTVLGGSHTWPGADPRLGTGLTTQQVDATGEILAFFGVGRVTGAGHRG